MSQTILIVGLMLLAYMYWVSTTEKYEAVPVEFQTVPVTSQIVNTLVNLVTPAVKKHLGCNVYPVETVYVRRAGDTFNCQFMYSVMDKMNYLYVTAVGATVQGENVTIQMQNEEDFTLNTAEAFQGFETSASLKEEPFPTLTQLNSALGR